MKNILVSLSTGELVLIYTPTLNPDECSQWAHRALHTEVVDSYEVQDTDLQYYCIDDRVYNTAEDDDKVRKYLAT